MTSRRDFIKGTVAAGAALALPSILKAEATPEPPGRIMAWGTGFPKLDEALGGGFRKGEYYVIMGVAGTGKSYLLQRWAKDQSPDSRYYKGLCEFVWSRDLPADNRLILVDDHDEPEGFRTSYGRQLARCAQDKGSAIVQAHPVNRRPKVFPIDDQPGLRCIEFHSIMYSPGVVMRLDNSERGKLYVEILKNLHGPLERIRIL